ncbi:hypothetical protein [Streptomyces sp. NBC_00299]|uniref:hypothetical protein n=1 Tax=Streptomyces sp. NBC_00299 TaxID=2975705 RepID=UPI002E2957B2|nr:hypothetical protein [Streptomyces sp. NBC_00299]
MECATVDSWAVPTECLATGMADACRTSVKRGGGGGNPDPSSYEPLHAGLLPAETRAYTDTTAARGTTHFYTLEALRADGSVAGTHVWNCVFQDRV